MSAADGDDDDRRVLQPRRAHNARSDDANQGAIWPLLLACIALPPATTAASTFAAPAAAATCIRSL